MGLLDTLDTSADEIAKAKAPVDLPRARALLAQGYTEARVAKMLGVPRSTLRRRLAAPDETAVIEGSDLQLSTLAKLDELCANEVEMTLERSIESRAQGKGPTIKPGDLKGILEASVKLARLIKGETTENVGRTLMPENAPPADVVRWFEERQREREELEREDEGEPEQGRMRV